MKKASIEFNVDDRVFAKVKGYPAWPARVTGPADVKKTRYNVFFYGTYETAVVKKDEMWPYNEKSLAKFGKQKRKGFAQGLQEIEHNPNIKTVEQLAGQAGQAQQPGSAESVAEEDPLADPLADPPPLLIDESPALTKKSVKRKANDSFSTTPQAPAKKVRRSTSSDTHEEKISRSGRIIKPKKYDEDEGESDDKKVTLPTIVLPKISHSEPSPKVEAKVSKSPVNRLLSANLEATDDVLQIYVDKDRPSKFSSKAEEREWEKEALKNANRFKMRVESGQFLPDEVRQKLEADPTSKNLEILKKDKEMASEKEKSRWMKVEQKLLELNSDLKMALHFSKPDMELCLQILAVLSSLAVAPLMLKKHPDIVSTIKKMRKYVGPADPDPDDEVNSRRSILAEKIRTKSESIYSTFQLAFVVPKGTDFWPFFKDKVAEFKTATKTWDKDKVLHVVSDPTLP